MKMGFKLQSWFRRRRSREEKTTGMVLTVTEDTPADMLAGSMELLVQLPRDHHIHTQRVTVERSTAMMDLLVQIATAHKLAASSYTLQAIGEHGLVLPHQSNTPIGALDALEVKLLPKQGTFIPRKTKQASQPFETTFRLQVHLPRNQLYVSRVSPKTNLGDILDEVCREKNLDKNKYELRHPGNHKETLDLSLSLQDYHLQEVTLYAKQGQSLGSALSSQDIMALQREEERRRQQAKQSVFGFIFKKSKESSLSTDSLGGRSVSPARSDETGRSVSPLAVPTRPQRKRRPAPNPPTTIHQTAISPQTNNDAVKDESKEKLVISHSRNSSDSSGYHEASVLSDNPDTAGRMPETLPRRSKPPGKFETRKLAQTSQTSKSLCNLATSSGIGLTHAISNTSLSSTGIRKKRAAPKPPISRPLSSAISTQALERIVDSEESLTSDMGISKPPSDIAMSSETETNSKANSDIAMSMHTSSNLITKNFCRTPTVEINDEIKRHSIAELDPQNCNVQVPHAEKITSLPIEGAKQVKTAKVAPRAPVPMPRSASKGPPITPRRLLNFTSSQRPIQEPLTSSIDNDSRRFDADDSGRKNLENQEIKKFVEYPNTNSDRVITENENEFAEMEFHDNEEAYQAVESNNNVADSSKSLNQCRNSLLLGTDNSLQPDQSCAIISTIPKCSHLSKQSSEILSKPVDKSIKLNNMANDSDKILLIEVSKNSSRSKVSRSSSASSNFEINTFEKRDKRHMSHDTNFICALNPNFPTGISYMGGDEEVKLDIEIPRNALSENDTPSDEQYPPFITHSTNLGLQMDLTHSSVEEKLHSQRMGKAGDDDSLTETDLLLQKVSTTLAHVSPTSERLSQDVPSNEVNHVESMNRVDSKPDEAPVHVETGLESAPNFTFNSQQDTSDYVSATGEDLSATDWEYQLPDPPSAFRDSVAVDYDGYDTITLSSVDAFKEPIMAQMNETENNTNRHVNVQKTNENVAITVPKSTSAITKTKTTYLTDEKSHKNNIVLPETKKDVNMPRLSSEERENNSNEELKRDVILELSDKIENGILTVPNCKNSEEETIRQSVINRSAPEIAPTESTLPNFKITTYSRQKSLNIYDSPASPSYHTDRLRDRTINTFATLSRNMSALPTKKGSYAESPHRNDRAANDFGINNGTVTRMNSVQQIKSAGQELKDSVRDMIKIPLRQPDTADSLDKSNVVHRSKSYIVLSHNSKYRGNKSHISNVIDDGRMLKSTSVTNLNQESAAIDEESLRSREMDSQASKNEINQGRELQSVQVLKSILPKLKVNQQLGEDTLEASVTKRHIQERESAAQSDEIDQVQLRNKTDTDIERKKAEPEDTNKRWRYTGPPAISLGSWSERPCLNVKIKMDTDYKFGVNNNNINNNNKNNNNNNNNNSNNNSSNNSNNNDNSSSSSNNNITGGKTVVNLNSTVNDVDIVYYKDSFMKNLPKNDVKNDHVKISSNDIKGPYMKRVMDDVGITKTKITNTSLNQMESGMGHFGFAKLRMTPRDESDEPVVVANTMKKFHAEKSELEDDDVKIDTRPVNFKELTQTFGQVSLRAKPKYNSQNRHSDYFDARQGSNDFIDSKIAKMQTNDNVTHIHGTPIKRYTSVIGIDAQLPTSLETKNDEIKKIQSTTMKVNGPTPIVKGFKFHHSNDAPRALICASTQRNSFAGSNRINSHIPPPPPTMPVITGVTLKSNNATPKSVSSCKDPRNQLLESIRSFGRDKLRSVDTVS